ncbi:MAG: hypothetical protein JWO95_3324 [Verrucomicrobiales bacterium]|nr:hypothetical protein [Verrucomicrobiales bacterium]
MNTMKSRHLITGKGSARNILTKVPSRPTFNTIKPPILRTPSSPPGVNRMPAVPACGGMDVWISAQQAGKILGIATSGIYRLIDPNRPFLVVKRPLPRKVLISLRSVTAFSEATKDAEFWESKVLQEQLSAKLRLIAENKA